MKKPTITFFNLGVLLLAFLGLNGNINVTFDQQIRGELLAKTQELEYSNQAPDEELYAQEFDSLGITLHPGKSYKPESNGSPRSLNRCKSLVYRTLLSLPPEPVGRLKNLTLYFSDTGRRGLGGGDTIILRCQNVTDEELVGVLVHEIGHITDTGVLNGSSGSGKSDFLDGSRPVYKDDESLTFYRLSWENEGTMKWDATAQDFVSGYAMTDPFEDFAESYAYYVLHGYEFRSLALQNDTLQKKYAFLKNRVFKGQEFFNGTEEEIDAAARHYDVTVLPYQLDKFLTV